MKRVPIDWYALEAAFEENPDEFGSERAHYFDLESGEVVVIDEYVRSLAGGVLDEFAEMSDQDADFTDAAILGTAAFQQLSEDEQSEVQAAIRIEYGDPKQFAEIPRFDSHQSYEYMRDFIETVGDEPVRAQLSEAITQRKPFRRFRDLLAGDRRLERQWREFEADRQRETMIAWLRGVGLEPTNPETATYSPPPLPDLRSMMFAEVRRFVRLACDIQGVRRIALIGSLCTDKEFPKDLDLLVTVSTDCELAPLAKLGRQLSGRMNNHRAGADVFLADEDGNYLGRTCPWKDCGPQHRASCDALHCGKRPYLHDDFSSVRLEREVIAHPPVFLWPEPSAAREVPRDVHAQLIERLAKES